MRTAGNGGREDLFYCYSTGKLNRLAESVWLGVITVF